MTALDGARAQIRLENHPAEIQRAAAQFDAFAQANAIPEVARRVVQIALDDMLQNIVSHGYADAGRHTIDLTLACVDGQLRVTITDDGAAFDPTARAAPDVRADIDTREVGGLGIFLVQSLMDHVSYSRQGDRNVLVFVKELAEDVPSRGEKG